MVSTLVGHAAEKPDTPALVDPTGTTTWAQLNELVNRWVSVFRDLGLEPGERVSVMAGNRREAWPLFHACLHSGLLIVPVNWELDVDEAGYVIRHCGARLLVAEDQTLEVAGKAAATAPNIETLLTFDASTGDGFTPAADLLEQASANEPSHEIAGAPMFYTSGTTGKPKGVISAGTGGAGAPVESLAGTAAAICAALGFPEGGTAMIVGPCYHSGQFVLSTFPMFVGQTLVIRRGPDAATILADIDTYGVTNTLLLPKDFIQILGLPPDVRDGFDGSSLRTVLHGGAPCPPDVKRAMIDWLGPIVTEYYGATEGGIFALVTSEEWLRVPGSVGRVLPFLELRIVDEEGEPTPTNREGVLYFRNLNGGQFRYHDDPEKTAAAHLEPGLFTVGDVGYVDDDGFLFVSGREAHLVRVGDERVHPNRVEVALSEHPLVVDIGAFAGPAPDGDGQAIHVAVVLREAAAGGEEASTALRDFALDTLPLAAVPASIHVVDQIPRSPAGKILRHELRDTLTPAGA